jgi:hypothetical protein
MSFIYSSLNNVIVLLAGTFLEYKPALEITRCSARDECVRSQLYGGRLYAITFSSESEALLPISEWVRKLLYQNLHYVADRHILKLIASSSNLIYEGTQG